jgi:hypothetical protein
MPARLIQAKSFLLLAIFLSAGTSLPSLDGLLFHLHAGENQRAQTHVEPAGGCLEHAEHCVLGRTATGSGAVATAVTEVRVEPGSRSALKPFPIQLRRSHTRVVHQPRAPPALRVV